MPRLLSAALALMLLPLPTLAMSSDDTTPLLPQAMAAAEVIAASPLKAQRQTG